MRCIDCEQQTTRVYNSGVNKEGVSFRFRICPVCGVKFKTEEVVMRRMPYKEDKKASEKIKEKVSSKRILYDKMLRPIPILDPDVDMW